MGISSGERNHCPLRRALKFNNNKNNNNNKNKNNNNNNKNNNKNNNNNRDSRESPSGVADPRLGLGERRG